MKTVTIIGGGLAGLSLGIGLRQRGIPVTLHEATTYPRHRVCGEFVCGVTSSTLKNLDIRDELADAVECKTTGWYHREKLIYQRTLPVSAFGLSRHLLDLRLAQKFENLGGQLFTSSRFSCPKSEEGVIWASGRKAHKKSSWIGLSMHSDDMLLSHDLEIHLGQQGYVGLSRIENNKVNLCGLFQKQPEITAKKTDLPVAYLRNSGFHELCSRIKKSRIDKESVVGVSHLNFDGHVKSLTTHLSLGDHSALIPPFTGNGMSMALESAEIALDPIALYANKSDAWGDTVSFVQKQMHNRFKKRLNIARLLHPFFYTTQGQYLLAKTAQLNLLPFKQIFQATH